MVAYFFGTPCIAYYNVNYRAWTAKLRYASNKVNHSASSYISSTTKRYFR